MSDAAPRADAPVWVILPTYDEADNLERAVAAILPGLRALAPPGSRVLVVDDASPDGTVAIADRLAAGDDGVEVLHRARKDGLGPAYVTGFGRALSGGAGFVVEMDADLSHDPAHLAAMVAQARAGEDVVVGSRYVPGGGIEGWGRLRRWLSRGGCLYARTVLGVGVRDLTSGYKCFRAEALRDIDYASVRSRGYAFQIELTYRALRRGWRVAEVPIVFRERRAGRSKMTGRIALEAAWRVAALRWTPAPAAAGTAAEDEAPVHSAAP